MAKWYGANLLWVRLWACMTKLEQRWDWAGGTSKVDLQVKEDDSEEATLGSTTRYIMLSRLSSIEAFGKGRIL